MKFSNRYAWLLPTLALAGLTAGALATGGGYPGGGYPGSGGGWVPSDSHGTPLTPGMQGTNSDGSANLLPTTGKSPKKTNTYPIQDGDPAWWFGAYSPNNGGTGDPYYYYYNGLFLSSTANNTTRDNYGALAASYDLNNYNFDRADNLTLPPDLTGSVHADNTDTLTAYFVWTGDPSHIPAHQDFLLRTSLSATAGVNFGNGGATSGLSATGEGMLEGDTVTATAGDAGNDHPAPHTKAVLVRATPTGNLITLSRSAGVSVDTSNSLPYATWVDSPALANASGPGTYYYIGPPNNGETSATASANASATANTDSRDVIIQSNLGQTYYKGINALPQPNMRQPDGTMTDDTAVYNSPGSGNFGVLVNYQAVTMGSWAVNSSYAWSNTATQWVTTPATQLHGTFNPNPITPLQVDYFKTSSSVPGSPGTTDNVHVLLTDGQDGATAAANYNLNFHAEYENFLKLTDVMQTGPWTRVSPAAVSGPNGGPFPLSINIPVSVTASVDPSGAAGSAVAAQYGVAVGTTYSTAVPRDASKWQMLPNKYCWIEDQVFWEHMTGTADNYEGQGYVQQISWSLDKPYNATNPLNDYTEQIINSDSPPTS